MHPGGTCCRCFKTKRCRFWLEGRCSRGDSCTYAHTEVELRPTPDLSKTKICSKWKKGLCDKPSHECTYAHGVQDLREGCCGGSEEEDELSCSDSGRFGSGLYGRAQEREEFAIDRFSHELRKGVYTPRTAYSPTRCGSPSTVAETPTEPLSPRGLTPHRDAGKDSWTDSVVNLPSFGHIHLQKSIICDSYDD